MPITISDIGRALLACAEDVSSTSTEPLVSAYGHQWSVLTVAAGQTWSRPDVGEQPMSMLVLEGHASCNDGSGRQSIGSGHLVIFDGDAPQTLTNETPKPFRAALVCGQPHAPGEHA
jgi:hypothetical protein